MNEKTAISDVLSSTNTMITLLNYSIEQANNKNFRDDLRNARNKLESLQWEVYTCAKDKGYYVPAAPGGMVDVEKVKNSVTK